MRLQYRGRVRQGLLPCIGVQAELQRKRPRVPESLQGDDAVEKNGRRVLIAVASRDTSPYQDCRVLGQDIVILVPDVAERQHRGGSMEVLDRDAAPFRAVLLGDLAGE